MARSDFGSVQTLKDGTHRGRYRVRGRDYYTPRERTKGAVKTELARVRGRLLDGSWIAPLPRRTSRTAGASGPLYVNEYAEQWLAGLNDRGMSPNTVRSYRSVLRAHILPVIGTLRLVDVTTDHLQAILDRASEKAPKTRANIARTVSAMLQRAVKHDRVLAKAPDVPSVEGVGTRQITPVALSAPDLMRLIEATDRDVRALVALASWCSLRYGEVAALQRKHIDTDAWTVKVERAVKRGPDGGPVFGPPKSKAGWRTIAIPPPARRVVAAHLKSRTAPAADALVFARPGGWGGLYSDRVLRGYLLRGLAKAGLPSMRFHDLRHTGLTLYGQAGATLADLMARAGHASIDTVKIYQHSSAIRDQELASRMG